MKQKRILLLLMVIFTMSFAYGKRKDKVWLEYVNEGLALYSQEKYEAAIEKYDKALNVLPNTWYAIQQKIYCLQKLGRTEEALKIL